MSLITLRCASYLKFLAVKLNGIIVQIGNEDFFASDSYGAYRWHDFVTNLTATFPQLSKSGCKWNVALHADTTSEDFLATTYAFNPILDPTPGFYDVHVYQTPSEPESYISSHKTDIVIDWFAENSFTYDGFEVRHQNWHSLLHTKPLLLHSATAPNTLRYVHTIQSVAVSLYRNQGEYASTSLNASDLFGTPEDGRLLFPTMQGWFSNVWFHSSATRNAAISGSSGEAAFMTGLERNADIVFAASYAPSFQNMGNYQWVSSDANLSSMLYWQGYNGESRPRTLSVISAYPVGIDAWTHADRMCG